MAFLLHSPVPSAVPLLLSQMRQSRSTEDREIGKQCACRTTGQTSVDFSNSWLLPFSSLGKLLPYVRMIKAAIMGRGFICILSIGTTNGSTMRTTTGKVALRNDFRVLDMELKNVI